MKIDALDLANRIVRRYISTWQEHTVRLNAPEESVRMARKGKRFVPGRVPTVKRRKPVKGRKTVSGEREALRNAMFRQAVDMTVAYATKDGAVASLTFPSYPDYPEDAMESKWVAEVGDDGRLNYKTKRNDISRLDNMILEETAKWAADNGLRVSITSDGGSLYEDND
jgi:hypothetical protein